jgi:hypothetical protein
VTRPGRSPLEGIDRLIVDANNLLHVGSRSETRLPASAVIGRLRAAIPPAVGIELVFDGAPDPGLRGERIASGLIVRHSGRRSADELIVSLVDEARRVAGPRGADNVLVVTDDGGLRTAVMRLGAATARCAWLLSRLARATLAAPATGNQRPPAIAQSAAATDESATTRRWRPGRRATVKLGNPRRSPRRRGG